MKIQLSENSSAFLYVFLFDFHFSGKHSFLWIYCSIPKFKCGLVNPFVKAINYDKLELLKALGLNMEIDKLRCLIRKHTKGQSQLCWILYKVGLKGWSNNEYNTEALSTMKKLRLGFCWHNKIIGLFDSYYQVLPRPYHPVGYLWVNHCLMAWAGTCKHLFAAFFNYQSANQQLLQYHFHFY